ncbi:hypothetical protein BD414DRAFT_540883 [Trametes punicea]|nr:hypothetical protein BD414DRAFT_540883 [Trametes punicea]
MANAAEAVLGGLMIALFFAFILYGITALQTFIYFQKYPTDTLALKAIVITVWVLESIHTAFCMHFAYAYLVAGFGDFNNLLKINWSIGITVLASAGIALCVQGYYTWRVWIISENSVICTLLVGFFSLLRVAFGIASAVLSYEYPDWLTLRHTKKSLITISGGLGSAALVDILVPIILSFYLRRGRQTWYRQTYSLANQILLYVVNTGAITGTTSLLCVILFAIEKRSLVFLGLVMIQGKLYANSLLGSLNARSHIRHKAALVPHSTFRGGSSRVTTPRMEGFQQRLTDDDPGLPAKPLSVFNLKARRTDEEIAS